jgi:molybdopterin-guanine dinucleotide biosynthesis protein A
MIDDIPCVILSGGKSSRMGEDKSFLPFRDAKTLIQYQYDKLSKIFSNVYISSKTSKFEFLQESSSYKKNLILDNSKDISSPMIALQSIFNKLTCNNIFIITVDTPLIKKSTIETIVNNSNSFDITIAADNNKRHNLCGVFNRSIIIEINKLLDNDIHKINCLIKNSNNCTEIYFKNNEQFININTISDYNRAKEIRACYI